MSDSTGRPLLSQAGRSALGGALRYLGAGAVMIPSLLLTAVYLSRTLGADGYGLYSLACAIVIWIEIALTSAFSRATIHFVSHQEDWRPVARTVLRLHIASGVGCAAVLALLAGHIAAWLGEPALAPPLRLLAIDIPIFSIGRAHRQILTGLQLYSGAARGVVLRWLVRLILIVGLVHLGLSVSGALLGIVGASLAELALYRRFIRPPLFGGPSLALRDFGSFAAPLLLFALCLRLFQRLDLLLLKGLGATVAQAGVYSAAQNLAGALGILTFAFAPPLLATISDLHRRDGQREVRALLRQALRGILLLLPALGAIAGAAGEIGVFLFGPVYAGVESLLPCLIVAAFCELLIGLAAAAFVGAGQPRLCARIVAPILPAAVIAHAILIPAFGATGAALATCIVALLIAALALATMKRCLTVTAPLSTALRSAAACGVTFLLASHWTSHGAWVLVKLPMTCLAGGLVLLALGEAQERGQVASCDKVPPAPAHSPAETTRTEDPASKSQDAT